MPILIIFFELFVPWTCHSTRRAQHHGHITPNDLKKAHILKQDFEKLLNEKDAWVVMFYAPWCAHCQVSPRPLRLG